MAGEQISTLIECWRTDERIMAGADGVSWVAIIVIVVSNPGLYGIAQYVHPLWVAAPCQIGQRHRAYSRYRGRDAMGLVGQFLRILRQGKTGKRTILRCRLGDPILAKGGL